MAEASNGRDHLQTDIAGQKVHLTTSNLVTLAILAVAVVGLWRFWNSMELLMRRDLDDRNRVAAEQHASHEKSYRLQWDVALATLRRLERLDFNIGRAPGDHLPPGVLPPSVEEALKRQLPPPPDR